MILVKVFPRSKNNRVEKIDNARFVVRITAPPEKGRANAAALKLLAKHLGVSPSRIKVVKGSESRNKVVEII